MKWRTEHFPYEKQPGETEITGFASAGELEQPLSCAHLSSQFPSARGWWCWVMFPLP